MNLFSGCVGECLRVCVCMHVGGGACARACVWVFFSAFPYVYSWMCACVCLHMCALSVCICTMQDCAIQNTIPVAFIGTVPDEISIIFYCDLVLWEEEPLPQATIWKGKQKMTPENKQCTYLAFQTNVWEWLADTYTYAKWNASFSHSTNLFCIFPPDQVWCDMRNDNLLSRKQ